jgi:hypothetical protein
MVPKSAFLCKMLSTILSSNDWGEWRSITCVLRMGLARFRKALLHNAIHETMWDTVGRPIRLLAAM